MRTRATLILLSALTVLLVFNLVKVLADGREGEVADQLAFAAEDAPEWDKNGVMMERTFSVEPGQLLDVRLAHADVSVETAEISEATVTVTLDARNMERARRYFEHLNISVTQKDGVIRIAMNPRRGSWNGSNGGADIDVLARIPVEFDVNVDLAHGDLDVDRLKGDADVNIAHGDVEMRSVSGPAIGIRAAHGDISSDELAAERIAIHTTHGDLDVGFLSSPRLEIRAAHSDVDVDRLEGYAEVSGAHGDIELDLAKTSGLIVNNTHGDIDISGPSDMPGSVDLSGSDVEISSRFAFQGVAKEKHAEGTLNGGGPTLAARTTHGDVILHAR